MEKANATRNPKSMANCIHRLTVNKKAQTHANLICQKRSKKEQTDESYLEKTNSKRRTEKQIGQNGQTWAIRNQEKKKQYWTRN